MRISTTTAVISALCAACAPLAAQTGTSGTTTRKAGATTAATTGASRTGTAGKTAASPAVTASSTSQTAGTLAAPVSSTGSNTSVGVRFGTLGIGLELSRLLGDHIGIRVGGNYLKVNRTQTEEDISYDATAKLQSFSGILDWYPGRRGAFHFSAGAVSNPLTVSGVGVPASGSLYSINNRDYTASQVGVFTSSAEYASVLPYVGFGFGTPASRSHGIGFLLDIGAAIGKPTILLNSSNAANVPGLAADIRAENVKLQKDADKLPVWPVVSLGLTYRF